MPLIRIPGFVDAHVHVESSHLLPSEFGRVLLGNGTTAAVCDPHEIVNVAGESGLQLMLEDARRSPCDLLFELPSCVPATAFETAGAALTAADTARLFDRYPALIGLGEVMNVPGVLNGDPEVLAKLQAAQVRGKCIEGHFPGGCGEALRRYAAAGITSDHESTTAEEALEKIACGQMVFLREGSAARNLEALLPAITPENADHFCFCSDDLSAADLIHGGILHCVRKAIRLGLAPELALQIACRNPRTYFHLPEDPETFVLLDSEADYQVVKVVKNGREFRDPGPHSAPLENRSSVTLPDLSNWHFPLPPPHGKARVITVIRDQLLTQSQLLPVAELERQKPARLAVIERHGKNGNTAFALVTGTGLCRGALATTIAHDSHNLLILGKTDAEMRLAAETLAKMGGGAVAVLGDAVLAAMPLPVGGLMSPEPAETVARQDQAVREAAQGSLGITLAAPLTTLSFLALPVIPALRLTDRGLFDGENFRFVPLYCD